MDRRNFVNTHTMKIFALAQMLALAGPTNAEVVGDVIAASFNSGGVTALFSATNGGQYSVVPCGGDLSHGGSPRHFLGSAPSGYLLPDGYEGSEMVVYDEACSHPAVITNAPDMRFSTVPHWSPDGTRIAVYAERWDLQTGMLAARGVFLADVLYNGHGFPTGTDNLRLVIPLPGEGPLDWSGDGEWLVYHAAASDGAGGSQLDLFLFDLATESSINVTNSPDISEMEPSLSPVDDRIAYTQLVQIRGSYRYDVFTIDVLSSAVVQITSKKTTGAPTNRSPTFSPDGQFLAFSSGSILGPIMPFDIYRIRSDGGGKPVNLTAKRDGDFRRPMWRN